MPATNGAHGTCERTVDMNERIICFTYGLSDGEIEQGKAAFHGREEDRSTLKVIPISETMLALNVGETVEKIVANPESLKDGEATSSRGSDRYRVVVIGSPDRDRVLQVMRSFKSVLADSRNVIFAMLTETAATWTFGEYIEHLGMEHEYMKTHNPAEDPDMKQM
ncbi:MAG TPA: DUF3783 domain-containing protein [Deltaproteobacteria bacterium]|nr:DUF3783 domain-containing protein [Deltaproteobacteria bacterium]